ncbi:MULTISPECIES: flavoprotein [Streptomyces]|uniref:Flavoprotein domain-containing protein n=1 Tax=Streptomyces luteosporeus TaxID=173856 RepID=A0ABN3TQM7_9ACTN
MTEHRTPGSQGPRILVGATGSIAVTMLPQYLGTLRSELGGTYTVLMTHTATQFLPAHTVQLSAERVVSGESPADWPTDKPSRLVGDHDILVVLPATANILSNAATGAATNRLSTVILGANFPVVFFPHMGSDMWNKPSVKRNIAQIREDGQHVAEPDWQDSYDVVSGTFNNHPTLPPPAKVARIVGELLAGRQPS